jgi:hypothetical protein
MLRVSVISNCVRPVSLLKISSVGNSGQPNSCGGVATIGKGAGIWMVVRTRRAERVVPAYS